MSRLGSRSGRHLLSAVCAASVASLCLAAPVAAAPQVKVREVYPGIIPPPVLMVPQPPVPGTGYVELQAYAAGQATLTPAHLKTWDHTGALTNDVALNNVANGVDQATVLIGGNLVTGPDQTINLFTLDPAGGAACVDPADPTDCVAWGPQAIPYGPALPGAVGTHAALTGIPVGSVLRRTIFPNCPSLLEAADDSDDSATDFSGGAPNPRNNATPPTESACTSGTLPALPSTTSTSTPQPTPSKKKAKKKCKKKKAKKKSAAAAKKCKKKKKK